MPVGVDHVEWDCFWQSALSVSKWYVVDCPTGLCPLVYIGQWSGLVAGGNAAVHSKGVDARDMTMHATHCIS